MKSPGAKFFLILGLLALGILPLQAFDQSDLQRLIVTEVVSRNTDLKLSELEVQILNWDAVRRKIVPLQSRALKFEIAPKPGLRLLGHAVIPLKITLPHQQVEWVSLQVQVQTQVAVCTAKRTLSPKVRVTLEMLEPLTKNVSALPQGFVRSCDSLVGLEVTLYVQSGSVLYPYQFRAEPQIRAQETIWLQLSRDGVFLKMEGQALEDGYVGQVIKVKNLRSGKKLKGRVSGFRSVTIVE